MKNFLVKLLRRSEIPLKANTAEEAAVEACQFFGAVVWSNEFEVHVEAVSNEAAKGDEHVNYILEAAKGNKRKKKNGRWKCLCEDYPKDDDIPF